MKCTAFAITSLLPLVAFGAGNSQQTPPMMNLQPAVVSQSATGELVYTVSGPDGKPRQVNQAFFAKGLESAIESAKKVVCEMNVLPQSVTISSVVVSVTYDTKQFCPKK